MINSLRKKYNLFALELDDGILNQIATQYANDMVMRNFVGHLDPDNQNPGDRARKLGLYKPIG